MRTSEHSDLVGGSTLRIDSIGKVTGRTRYVEDIALPGLLYARVLRSPHHHARLLGLAVAEAAALPGVVRIITADDIPGLNGLDGYSRDEPLLAAVGDTLRQPRRAHCHGRGGIVRPGISGHTSHRRHL